MCVCERVCVSVCVYVILHSSTLSAEALIPQLSQINQGDRSGKTPLHHAAYMGHSKMVSLLLMKGANPKLKDRRERTALHLAALMGAYTVYVLYIYCIYCICIVHTVLYVCAYIHFTMHVCTYRLCMNIL